MKPIVRESTLRLAFNIAYKAAGLHPTVRKARLVRQVAHALRSNKGRIYGSGRGFSVQRGKQV